MGLEAKVGAAVDSARSYVTSRPDKITEYLKTKRLARYFEGLSDEERKTRESSLEQYVQASVAKYDTELKGIRKAVTKPAMALAFLNDAYSLVSKAPFSNFSALSYVLFGAKTLAEVPALYRYLKKSHDWYGAAEWAVMKPINYILPFVGPALESGLFERIVKRRVIYEATNRFMQSLGYETEPQKAKRVLGTSLKDKIDPSTIQAPIPAPA